MEEKRKLYSIVLIVLLVVGIWLVINDNVIISKAATSENDESTEFAGGNGTEENPYQISSDIMFREMAKYPGKYFVLISDLDLSDSPRIDFEGTFDGNGHTIDIDFSEENGMFNELKEISVVENCTINIGNEYYTSLPAESFGAVALHNNGLIKKCVVSGTVAITPATSVAGDITIGSICSVNYGEIKMCRSDVNYSIQVNMAAEFMISGICNYGTAEQCLNTGNIGVGVQRNISTSGSFSNSVAGIAYSITDISECANTGDISLDFSSSLTNSSNIYNYAGFVSSDEFTSFSYVIPSKMEGMSSCYISEDVEFSFSTYNLGTGGGVNSESTILYADDVIGTQVKTEDEILQWWDRIIADDEDDGGEIWIPDGTFNIAKTGDWVSGEECILHGEYSASVPGNVIVEASDIVWTSSDPSILEVSETATNAIADAGRNRATIQKTFIAKKVGVVTITATAPDGRSVSIEVDIEPRLMAVETNETLTEETKVTLFQATLEEADAEYLEDFISDVEVEVIGNTDNGETGNRVFDIIDSYYEISEDGLTAKIIYDIVPLKKGNVKFQASTPSGQTAYTSLHANYRGFSASKDGWCIINAPQSFGDKDDKIPLSYYFTTFGITLGSSVHSIIDRIGDWGGYCFGMSLLSIAEYNGQVDLSPYFNNGGDSLNEYGFERIEYMEIKDSNSKEDYIGNIYTLQGNKDIIELIQRAQISQYSSEIAKAEVFAWDRDYSGVLNHLNQDDAAPLLITITGVNHAIVAETRLKPTVTKDGLYKIYCYNSNIPQLTNKLNNASPIYSLDKTYILLDTNTGDFLYYDGRKGYNSEYSTFNLMHIRFYDIRKLDNDFFNWAYTLDEERTTNIFNAAELTINQKNEDGMTEEVFSVNSEKNIVYKNPVEYRPIYENNVFSSNLATKKGYVLLPHGIYELNTKDETSIVSIQDDYIYAYNIDGDAKTIIEDSNIIIKNECSDNVNFTIAIQNMNGTVTASAKGTLDPSTNINLKIVKNEDIYSAESKTDSKVDDIETNLILNGVIVSENYHTVSNGWKKVGDNDWAYYKDGEMVVSNWVSVTEADPYNNNEVGEVWYHFGADGLMQRGWIIDETGWKVYLLDSNGRMMHSDWVNAPKNTELNRPAGIYHLTDDGAVQMNGWALAKKSQTIYWYCNPGTGLFEKNNPGSWSGKKLW